MNPSGHRGSKSLVNLMRIGQWTVESKITEDGKYVLLYIIEDCYQDELVFHTNQPRNENCDDFDLEMALSLSLSLADPPPYSADIAYSNQGTVNMSYESLVQLENVKCVAPANVVNSMPILTFDGNKPEQGSADEIEKCVICQCEYEFGDQIISLPCTHGFHYPCGAEWLLNHSKLCPISKNNVMDQSNI